MIHEAFQNMGWAAIFAILGGVIGMMLILISMRFIPNLIARLTPHLDEEKEMARGNLAVATYFGKVVAATILGISLIIAAAVLGGILAGLH